MIGLLTTVGMLALLGGAGVYVFQSIEDRGAAEYHRSVLSQTLKQQERTRIAERERLQAQVSSMKRSNDALAKRIGQREAELSAVRSAPVAGRGQTCPADCTVSD